VSVVTKRTERIKLPSVVHTSITWVTVTKVSWFQSESHEQRKTAATWPQEITRETT